MALEYPSDLKYSESHEYVRLDGDIATIGISAFAVDQLGDIVFVELSDIGEALEKGDNFGTIESVKAVEDLKAPVSGTVVEVNEPVQDAPEVIGDDTYGEGWLIKVRVADVDNVFGDDIFSADAYQEMVAGE